jgi:eukaryotic-like serine/threonine-protein kinase
MKEEQVIEPGATVGGYTLEVKVGNSHLGEIYLAYKAEDADKEDKDRVRIEILSGEVTSDEESVTRFLQEIELMSSLTHENLLSALEAGQDGETYFLVTAHEPGQSLEELIKQGAIEEKLVLSILISIAEVLKYTWDERKLLHRDLKPENIFITEEGKAKLTGFGIAKSSEGQSMGLTGVGFTIGTPEYMSPEQIRAAEDIDFRSDIYALGVLMYEALVGELPFVEEAPILLMQRHMDEVPVPVIDRIEGVSPGCSALVDRMLAKDREDRQQSWQELIDDANEVLTTGGQISKKAASRTAGQAGQGPLGGGGISPGAIFGIVVAIVIVIIIVILVVRGAG